MFLLLLDGVDVIFLFCVFIMICFELNGAKKWATFINLQYYFELSLAYLNQTAGISFRAFHKLGTEPLPLGLEMLISKLIFLNALSTANNRASVAP